MKKLIKITGIGVAFLLIMLIVIPPVSANPPVRPSRVETIWYPPYGFLVGIDITGDDNPEFYIDMWSNIYLDVDGDGIMDIKILRDGTIIILTPGTEEPELVWSDDGQYWGIDITEDGLIDLWKFIGGPGVYIIIYPDDGSDPVYYFTTPAPGWPVIPFVRASPPSRDLPIGDPYMVPWGSNIN